MAEGWREFLSQWDDFSGRAEHYHEIDSERVLVMVRNSGLGKVSGVQIGQMQEGGANVFHIRDGKVVKLVLHWDRHQALADLGLTPDTGT